MSVLIKNILYQFRYYLVIVIVLAVAILIVLQLHKNSERAAQAQAAAQAEKEKIQQDESNQVAQVKAQQAQAQLEESNRLAKVQEAEIQKQAMLQEEESRQQAIQKASADLNAYKERYLMPVDQGQNISASRLVVAVASQNQLDTDLTQTISLMANRAGFSTVDSLLKSEFVTDGLFDKAFNGEFDSLNELALTNDCEFLALCQFTAIVTPKPAFQANVADGKLQIKLFRVGSWKLVSTKEYNADASAFQPEEAIALVHKKFVSLLTTNSFPYQIPLK